MYSPLSVETYWLLVSQGDIGEITQSLAAGNKFLQFISLSDNILSGTLHEESLCKLAHGPLLFLNFRENDIEGKIPACLFDETSSVKEAFLGTKTLSSQSNLQWQLHRSLSSAKKSLSRNVLKTTRAP